MMNTPFAQGMINVNGLYFPINRLITLVGAWKAGGGVSITTLRSAGATSGYQVPSGKTFKGVAAIFRGTIGAGANGNLLFTYGDTDVGVNAGAGPTNETGAFAGCDTTNGSGNIQIQAALTESLACILGSAVPASKYPCIRNFSNNTGNGIVMLMGYLE